MPYCEKCGAQLSEDSVHCPRCGKPVKERAPRISRRRREQDQCFGGGEVKKNQLGMVSFGFFIIIVAVVYLRNPNIISLMASWFRLLVERQILVRPPLKLIKNAVLFFMLIGFSSFATAVIRWLQDGVVGRVLGDVLSGTALILFAYLINLYGRKVIAWTMVFAVEAIYIGLLVVAYSAYSYYKN